MVNLKAKVSSTTYLNPQSTKKHNLKARIIQLIISNKQSLISLIEQQIAPGLLLDSFDEQERNIIPKETTIFSIIRKINDDVDSNNQLNLLLLTSYYGNVKLLEKMLKSLFQYKNSLNIHIEDQCSQLAILDEAINNAKKITFFTNNITIFSILMKYDNNPDLSVISIKKVEERPLEVLEYSIPWLNYLLDKQDEFKFNKVIYQNILTNYFSYGIDLFVSSTKTHHDINNNQIIETTNQNFIELLINRIHYKQQIFPENHQYLEVIKEGFRQGRNRISDDYFINILEQINKLYPNPLEAYNIKNMGKYRLLTDLTEIVENEIKLKRQFQNELLVNQKQGKFVDLIINSNANHHR